MPSFLLQYGSQIITGLFGLSGSIIGSVATIIVYKLNERTRRLDLYRQVYPEKLKTAQALMQQSDALFQIAYFAASIGDLNDVKLKNKVLEEADKLYDLSTASEWLLGSEVRRIGVELVKAARSIFTPAFRDAVSNDWLSDAPHDGGNGKNHALYASLSQAVRKELHFATLDKLIPKQ